MPTNDNDLNQPGAHDPNVRDDEHPGYEVTDVNDGNQATADLHAREDLLLNNYSVSPKEGGAIRIPISRAMEIIAQRGLPVNTEAAPSAVQMAGDEKPTVQAPLTSGFARTGYELETIEAREQKLNYGRAVGENKAELAPV